MQAITTRYIGPTNTKPARIRAECAAKCIRVAYDHELGIEQNHIAAGNYLAKQLGWPEPSAHGCMKNGNFCHVIPHNY